MNSLQKAVRRISSRKSDHGFTLIELVVVVVIIGILTAIAIPSYGAIQHTARQNTAQTAADQKFKETLQKLANGETVPTGSYTDYDNPIQYIVTVKTTPPVAEGNLIVIALWRGDSSVRAVRQ